MKKGKEELKKVYDKIWKEEILPEIYELHKLRLSELSMNMFYQLEEIECINKK